MASFKPRARAGRDNVDEKIIAVNTPPCEVIRVSLTPGHEKQAAKVCYEIGNRHAPLFWGENDTFITIYNEPMLLMLQKLHGVTAEKELKKLAQKMGQLERKIKKEKQFNRQVELREEYKKLKKQWEAING